MSAGRRIIVCVLIATSLVVAATAPVSAAPPNIVVVLTDDQPVGTLQQMSNVQELRASGVTFRKAIATNPLCCPSRASILTGLFSHHTGVYTNGDHDDPSIGGYPAFRANGNLSRTIAVLLDEAGYRTGLFGKFLNHYVAGDPIPPGWDRFHAFVGANGAYYDYDAVHSSIDEGIAIRSYGWDPSDYSTGMFGRRTLRFLRSQDGSSPFFALFAPYAPHGPKTPGPRDGDVTAPRDYRSPAWNERDVSDKPPHIQDLALIRRDLTERWDNTYATLASVDRWLGRFRNTLAERGLLRRTVFVFMSDNGHAWGDHRWFYKRVPYERSIKVPFVISGPGIPHRAVEKLVSNIDLTPTLLDLAGLSATGLDGRSLLPLLAGGSIDRSSILLEHAGDPDRGLPSYCGLRTPRWKYVVYATGFEELYDLSADPHEMDNIAPRRSRVTGSLRERTRERCDPLPPGFPPGFWSGVG